MKKVLTASLALAGVVLAQENQPILKISQPLELSGAITGAYFYTNNEGPVDSQDGFRLTNAIVNLKGSSGNMGFDLALGGVFAPSVWLNVSNAISSYTSGALTQNEVGVLWGYVSYSPVKGLTLDAGLLPTNIGYEVVNTYANPNINLGAVWYAQPIIYPGARLTYNVTENISLYAEYNNDSINPRGDAFALGSSGSFGNMSYALNYYDYAGLRNFIDAVLSYSAGNVDLGLNFDYHWLDDSAKTPNRDVAAYGLAVYIIPQFGNISVPLRLEYFDEGTSGIYSGGNAQSGYTVTLTPTLKPSDNSFVRAEVSYISTDQYFFNNGTENSKTTLAVELGFTF